MIDLFCNGNKAKNNEEYKLVLKKRQKTYWGLFGVGVLTVALGAVLSAVPKTQVNGRQTGFVLGLGTGLCLGAVCIIWGIRRIMGDEEQLKKRRLKEVDEREVEVRSKALQASAKILLAALYCFVIIGGLFADVLTGVCGLLICMFFLSYILLQKYYGKKL